MHDEDGHPLRPQLTRPSALELALEARARGDWAARARVLESQRSLDPRRAAVVAYELGELAELRLRDDERALAAYRRAYELDATLAVASWALRRSWYRRAAWDELATALDRAAGETTEGMRANLLMERASLEVPGTRAALGRALELEPSNQGVLLQLERKLAPSGVTESLLGVWDGLAAVVEHPARKLGYLVELGVAVAATDLARSRQAFARAATLATSPADVHRIARGWLDVADWHGTPDDIDAALADDARSCLARVEADERAQAGRLSTHRRELVAVLRRQHQHARDRPRDAWRYLVQAHAVLPADPLVVLDLIEHAPAAGRADELPALAQTWLQVETEAGRRATVLAWYRRLLEDPTTSAAVRGRLGAVASTVPGYLPLLAIAEAQVIADATDVNLRYTLAERYLESGQAAVQGTWLVSQRPPDPAAAVALFIQAAHVFAHHLEDGDELDRARSALELARHTDPAHPLLLEAAVDLEDEIGDPQEAIARLLGAERSAPALQRAIRIARTHGLPSTVLELESELLAREPLDVMLAWQHECTLLQLGRDDERAEILTRIGHEDSDPARRYTALVGAARIAIRLGAVPVAVGLLRTLRAREPRQHFAREALIDLLRRDQDWSALVVELRIALDEPDADADAGKRRRRLRELAWVFEVCLQDPAGAAAVYAEWVAWAPTDRTALEGLARCRAELGDRAGERTARKAILDGDPGAEVRWLYARSLERAGDIAEAVTHYRAVLAGAAAAESAVATLAPAAELALLGIAARTGDVALRAEATTGLLTRCTDAALAGALHAELGWHHTLITGDRERAADAFAEASELAPYDPGAQLGAVLEATRIASPTLASRYVALADAAAPTLAIALRLRAAVMARAAGEVAHADELVAAARAVDPAHVDVQFHETEHAGSVARDGVPARATALAARGALSDDPAVRAAWELDRADLLEAAGQPSEAAHTAAAVLRDRPRDRRALLAVRRLALRQGNAAAASRASAVLATQTLDPAWHQALLREAAPLPPRPSPAGARFRDEPTGTRSTVRILARSRSDTPGMLDQDSEVTDAESLTPIDIAVDAPAIDPFGGSTVRADLADLQDAELDAGGAGAAIAPVPDLVAEAAELGGAFARESLLTPDPLLAAELRVEAGRWTDLHGDRMAAREHYRAALALHPGAVRALHGLRLQAWRERDLPEVSRLLALELEHASERERGVLQRYCVEVRLALRDDAGAIAALDALEPTSVVVRLMQLQVAYTLGDRAAIERALQALDASADATAGPPGSSPGRSAAWRALWEAVRRADIPAAAAGLLELAYHVEADDPTLATALAAVAQSWALDRAIPPGALGETALEAAQLTSRIASRDPLVARIAAETALAVHHVATASHAFAQWARSGSAPADRAYAAARAAELDPVRLGRLWASALDDDGLDAHAASRLRRAHLAAGKVDEAIALDLRIAEECSRVSSLLDAADVMLEETRVDAATDTLAAARARWPASLALVEALGEALAGAGRWAERAELLDALATSEHPMIIARDVARLRAAAAWELAARDAAHTKRRDPADLVAAALRACARVLDDDGTSLLAHGAALHLASAVPDPHVTARVLERLRSVERSPFAAASLALRQARVLLGVAPHLAVQTARRTLRGDDPRSTVTLLLAAAQLGTPAVAIAALEDRATVLAPGAGEAVALRFRAAGLAATHPDNAGVAPAFAQLIHDAERALARNEPAVALAAFERARLLQPADPLVLEPLLRAATASGHADAVARVLRDAIAAAPDAARQLELHERMARDAATRGDRDRMLAALRAGLELDPDRLDLQQWLERALAALADHRGILRARDGLAARATAWPAGDRHAVLRDTLQLAVRWREPDAAIEARCREVLAVAPSDRVALFHLESRMRRDEPALELAVLMARIAALFDEPRSQAACFTRAGDTLARVGHHREAGAAFARALDACPGYPPALDGWRASAIDGGRWQELRAVAARHAHADAVPSMVAAAHHLAGVALMDEAAAADPDGAIEEFRRVLAAEPAHRDAVLRLRILLERSGRVGELAELLEQRLEIEPSRTEQVELQRALAELHFAADRDRAAQRYRALLAIDPTDARAQAALVDLASAPGAWEAASEAITARLALEDDPRVLWSLYTRLGTALVEHDPARAFAAFQRAATYRPDDRTTTSQLATLGVRVSAWNVALDASEQLVASTTDPRAIAVHLQRIATIYGRGLHEPERAERALETALETDPTAHAALEQLLELYSHQPTSARLADQLRLVVDRARARIAALPADGPSYHMIACASEARARAGMPSAMLTARAAAEIAQLLGSGTATESRLLAASPVVDLSRLRDPALDPQLIPGSITPALHAALRDTADAITKLFGVDLGAFGVTRKQRLQSSDPVVTTARAMALALGLGAVDVYVSPQAFAVAEPSSPITLVLGQSIIAGGAEAVACATGAALKMVQLALAIPARMPPAALALLVTALARAAERGSPRGASPAHPEADAAADRLLRALPTSQHGKLRAHADALGGEGFPQLARDLQIVRLRAGFLASGSLRAALGMLVGAGAGARAVLMDPVARAVVGFALGEL